MGLTITWDTTPFSAADSCFDAFKAIPNLNIDSQVELINKSPVMIALLQNSGGSIITMTILL